MSTSRKSNDRGTIRGHKVVWVPGTKQKHGHLAYEDNGEIVSKKRSEWRACKHCGKKPTGHNPDL